MKHRFITQKRDGLHWIVGTKLVEEFGKPCRPQDIEAPPDYDLFDDLRRPLYVLTLEGPVFQGRPAKELEHDQRCALDKKNRAFLRETDWYVIREAETGTPVPEDVKAQRQAAREAVSE